MPSTETWISIATIIIPSITTVLIGYWQIRVMRAIANPATNQPKQRTARRDGLSTRRVKKWLAALLGTGIPIASLVVTVLRSGESVDRWSVLAIAVCVGWIMVQIAVLLSVYTVYKIWFSPRVID